MGSRSFFHVISNGVRTHSLSARFHDRMIYFFFHAVINIQKIVFPTVKWAPSRSYISLDFLYFGLSNGLET